ITNNVKILSSDYGIYGLGGTINYYGGTITAPEAVYGYINNVPEEYDIIKSIDDSNNEVYEIGKLQEIVSVGETTYNSLEEAISSNESGTITLLKDIAYATSEKQTINNNQNFVLDLNGHSIKLHNSEAFITNYGTFKVTDNTESQNEKIYGYAQTVIQNEGNFEMAGGTIKINQTNGNKVIYNTGEGIIKVSGGTLYSTTRTGRGDYYIIYSDNNNDINVTGGTFSLYGSNEYAYLYAIYTEAENTTINVSGGTFKHEKIGVTYMIYMKSGGNVNVSGNATSNNTNGIYLEKSGIVNISDEANLNNKENSIWFKISDSSEVNISGGTIKGRIHGNSWGAIVTLTGGNVTGGIAYCRTVDVYEGVNLEGTISACTNVNIYEGAIVTSTGNAMANCSNVNINNGTINGSIYMNAGTLNMTSGSITGKNYGIQLAGYNPITSNITGGTITATAGPGILISTKTGTLNLGEDTGGYPSTEVPTITGSTYGVKNDGGTFNFYDGILTGGTEAIIGTVTKTPDSFKVLYSEGGKVAILGIEATFEQVAKVNGVYYNDLESAMNSAININGKVELCKDITTGSSITIPAGKTVTIDMQGYSINGYTETEALFINNGTLIIQDSTNEGTNESKVKSHTGTVIVNNGTLTLGVDDGIVYTNSPNVIGKTIAIENNGTFNFFDGQIGIFDLVGDILNNEETINIPEGYKTIKLEGSNIYTLVEKTDTDTNS
ncbi:MAG TPA: hypothetical protein DCZ30_08065, partial [Clostridiales bacterium]|nr:hypothetical protein [Clostridiales bacterium]